jgi:signal peptidase I
MQHLFLSFIGSLLGGIGGILYIGLIVLAIVGLWKLFEKAGKPGWASLIPIYNIIVMFEIVGKPYWQLVLFLVPFANIYVAITLVIGMAKSFGKFGIGNYLLALFFGYIMYPIWGFDANTRYLGPSEGPGSVAGNGGYSPNQPTY